jgi:uncharacterized repeat protein (TIGR01451 family)
LVKPAGEPLTPTLTFGGPGTSAADLAIQAIHGETGVYTLTVRNLGPELATGIVLTDVLPSGVIPLWTEPAQPVCGRQQRGIDCDLGDLQAGDAATVTLDLSVGGSEGLITSTEPAGVIVTLSVPVCAIEQDFGSPQVTCRLSKLQPGAEAQVHIGLAVDSPLVGEFVHTATVTADELDPDGSNNQATFTMEFDPAGPVVAAGAPTPADLVLHADGPASATAGQPFTYTYTIANRGAVDATGVWFQDIVPSDLNLVSYAPGPPRCEQHGDALTCTLRDPDGGEAVTFTVLITGHGEQPMQMGLDVLMPGWPVCGVIKERTWLQVVQCELGELAPGQEIQVQLAFVAIGVAERMTVNTATIHANVADLNRVDITSTVTITIQAGTEPSGP